MRILITGGAGFQGSHLAERWSGSGHGVTILNTYSEEAARNIRSVSADSEVVWGSVTDNEIVEKTVRGHDVVVHLAARVNVDESLAEPRAFADVNLDGTINVLEAARRWGSRVVFGSSCEGVRRLRRAASAGDGASSSVQPLLGVQGGGGPDVLRVPHELRPRRDYRTAVQRLRGAPEVGQGRGRDPHLLQPGRGGQAADRVRLPARKRASTSTSATSWPPTT